MKRPPNGALDRHLNAIPPALERLARDLDRGLTARPALADLDDEALSGLA